MPRLLYLKAPAPERDPRLTELVQRIEEEASYRRFRTPAELGRLVRDDLAHLLSERFATGTPDSSERPPPPAVRLPPVALSPAPLPVGTTPLIGREEVIDEVADLHAQDGQRLITLTGPSGIGKTRLATAVAERSVAGQAVFVPLAEICRRLEGVPLALELAAAGSGSSTWSASCIDCPGPWTPLAPVLVT